MELVPITTIRVIAMEIAIIALPIMDIVTEDGIMVTDINPAVNEVERRSTQQNIPRLVQYATLLTENSVVAQALLIFG